jgi:hypothetical protein
VYKTAVIPRHADGWRRVVLALALLAFALQGYITQTHIHFATGHTFGLSGDNFAPAVKLSGDKSTPAKKTPSNDDPANCPLCQAAAHSGQFITPSAIGFALPSETVAIVPLAIVVLTASEIISHGWQSRAPPRH